MKPPHSYATSAFTTIGATGERSVSPDSNQDFCGAGYFCQLANISIQANRCVDPLYKYSACIISGCAYAGARDC